MKQLKIHSMNLGGNMKVTVDGRHIGNISLDHMGRHRFYRGSPPGMLVSPSIETDTLEEMTAQLEAEIRGLKP